MTDRANIFATLNDVKPTDDLADFRPSQRIGPTAEQIDETTKFPRRQPSDGRLTVNRKSSESQSLADRKPLVYRTGRNRVLSVKTSADFVERFYAMAERQGWKASETFEKALEALERGEAPE